MILHGDSDQLVPHNQGEQLYMALNKACKDAIFISLPKAPHGNWNGFLTDDALREAATMRSTSAAGCTVTNPTPYHADVEDGDRLPRQVHESRLVPVDVKLGLSCGRRHRPPLCYDSYSMAKYSIGVDLGGTNFRAAAIDQTGHLIDRISGVTDSAGGCEAIVGALCGAVTGLRDKRAGDELAGIGIVVPGFIDMAKGLRAVFAQHPAIREFLRPGRVPGETAHRR